MEIAFLRENSCRERTIVWSVSKKDNTESTFHSIRDAISQNPNVSSSLGIERWSRSTIGKVMECHCPLSCESIQENDMKAAYQTGISLCFSTGREKERVTAMTD